MNKKIISLLAALTLTAASLSSCESSDGAADSSAAVSGSDSVSENSSSETSISMDAPLIVNGEEVDTDGLIMCTIDGIDVDFDTFRYYYHYTIDQYETNYGIDFDTLVATDGGFDLILEGTVTSIKQEYVSYRLCEENGLELTDEDLQDIEDQYNSTVEAFDDEDAFIEALEEKYLTEDLYKEMIKLATLYEKCENELFTNGGVYATSQDEFLDIVQDPDQYACIKSILIPYFCKVEITDSTVLSEYDSYSLSEKYSAKESAYSELEDEDEIEAVKTAAEELAESVAEKLENGEDFDSLLDQYNWDYGMESYPEGYYLTPDSSYDENYLEAAFSLEEGEVSGVIESETYGWFILKRMPVDLSYVEDNIEELIEAYDLPARQELYSEIMEDMDVSYSDVYENLTSSSIS